MELEILPPKEHKNNWVLFINFCRNWLTQIDLLLYVFYIKCKMRIKLESSLLTFLDPSLSRGNHYHKSTMYPVYTFITFICTHEKIRYFVNASFIKKIFSPYFFSTDLSLDDTHVNSIENNNESSPTSPSLIFLFSFFKIEVN